MGLIHTSS